MIRRANLSDLNEVMNLSLEWEKEEFTYGLVANPIETLKRYMEHHHFWAMNDNTKIIGYAFGEVKTNPGLIVFNEYDLQYFELEEIYIHKDYRSQGKGQYFLQTIIAELEGEGIKRILVSSANKNWKRIYEFYLKNGFNMWTITMTR